MALGKNLTKPDPKTKEEKKASKTQKEDANESEIEAKGAIIEPSEATVIEESDEESGAVVNYEQYCVFRSGKEEYALHINLVKEVVPFPHYAPVPHMPDYIVGMANVRGNIYGIVDLASFFHGKREQTCSYLLVLDVDEYQIGIVIPDVPDTLMVTEEEIEALSSSRQKSKMGQKYLKGIIKKDRRMIVQFDILEMISSDQFTVRS